MKFYDHNKTFINDHDVTEDADLVARVDSVYLDEIDLDYNKEHYGNPHDVELTGVDKTDKDKINELMENQAIHGENQDIHGEDDQNHIENAANKYVKANNKDEYENTKNCFGVLERSNYRFSEI